MKNKSILYAFVVLVIGMLLGTVLSLTVEFIFSSFTPEGFDTNQSVVYRFLTNTTAVGWGASDGSESWVKLGFMRFRTGFFMELSILSLMGFFISWYFLRYFK